MKNQFWRLERVLEETGLSRPALYRAMAAGEFPANFNISERAVAWHSDEVDAWKAAQRARGSKAAA